MITNINQTILLAQSGNIEARTKVLEFALPRIEQITTNKDVIANSVLRISKYINSFNSDKGEFLNWVSALTKNEKLKNWERLKKEDDKKSYFFEDYDYLYDVISKVQPETFEFDRIDLKPIIIDIVQGLKPSQRETFKLWAFEGLNHQEIAKYKGVHEGTSKSNLNRAKENIKKELLKMGYDGI